MKWETEACVCDVCPERSKIVNWVEYLTQGLELLFLGMGTFFDVKDRKLPVFFLFVFGSLGVIWNLLWKYQSLRELVLGVCLGGTFLAVGFIIMH